MAMRGRRSQQPDGVKSAHLRWKDLFLAVKPCERCGGLLTRDEELSASIDRQLPSLRCIQCGDSIDEIILRNRMTFRSRGTPTRRQAIQLRFLPEEAMAIKQSRV